MDDLKANGVFRPADSPTAINVVFNRRLSDDEMRLFHEWCRQFALSVDQDNRMLAEQARFRGRSQ